MNVTIGKKAYSICSIYIPLGSYLQVRDLDDIKNQLPGPVIFMGDFNAHNPFWGCSYTNTKGKLVEEFIVENDLIIFNNKFPTHYDIFHNSTSIIDLTICQPSVFLDFTCNVFNNTHGSDHYPIQLVLNDQDPENNSQVHRWNFRKADWMKFKNLCQDLITEDLFITDSDDMSIYNNDKMRVFSESLLSIATESIPQTAADPSKKPKPWFDEGCKTIIKQRAAADRKCKKYHNDENVKQAQLIRAKMSSHYKTKETCLLATICIFYQQQHTY